MKVPFLKSRTEKIKQAQRRGFEWAVSEYYFEGESLEVMAVQSNNITGRNQSETEAAFDAGVRSGIAHVLAAENLQLDEIYEVVPALSPRR